MEWWYADKSVQMGPVTEEALGELVRAGTVQPSTLVWHSGLANWMPYSQALPAGGQQAVTMYCSECGRPFAPAQLTPVGQLQVCGECRRMVSAPPVRQFVYGGFWIRFLARIIDAIVLGVLYLGMSFGMLGGIGPDSGVYTIAASGVLLLLNIGLSCAYETVLVVTHGGTLGKLALGLQVVTPDGARLTYGRAAGRYFAQWINSFTLGIGYIIAGIDDQKRALHDHICGTRVIRKQA